jgi:hypothetical protein
MMILSKRETMWTIQNGDYDDRTPFQWAYSGPDGQEAIVDNLGLYKTWQVLFRRNGVATTRRLGPYANIQQIEAVIEKVFAGQEPPSKPQVSDRVRVTNPTGQSRRFAGQTGTVLSLAPHKDFVDYLVVLDPARKVVQFGEGELRIL